MSDWIPGPNDRVRDGEGRIGYVRKVITRDGEPIRFEMVSNLPPPEPYVFYATMSWETSAEGCSLLIETDGRVHEHRALPRGQEEGE